MSIKYWYRVDLNNRIERAVVVAEALGLLGSPLDLNNRIESSRTYCLDCYYSGQDLNNRIESPRENPPPRKVSARPSTIGSKQ